MREAESSAGYRPIDHTGDVAIELWAPTEAELLEQAARAAVSLMTGEAEPAERAEDGEAIARHVALETLDPEDRLVQWLNEVIYWAVCEGALVRSAEIEIRSAGEGETLRARARATPVPDEGLATELKSATYHDLRVERGEDGIYRARVVIDV